MNLFFELNPALQALIAGIITLSITALGSAIVFLFKSVNKTIMDAMLGISAGVMIAASFFSLLEPAIKMTDNLKMVSWLIVSLGFLSGGLLLFLGDKIFSKKIDKANDKVKRSIMLIISITLHNIPEGMAIGVAFGSIIYGIDGSTITSAIMLAIGIGIQNFPEGSAISLPLKRDGFSSKKAFFYGSISAIVEPISALLGALLVLKIRVLLPILLSFAAGAMIYVVIEELVPESQTNEKKDLMALATIIGFIIMMIFDVALG